MLQRTRSSSLSQCSFSVRLLLIAAMLLLARPVLAYQWHNTDITGYVPKLAFNMMDANTGKPATQAAFKGKFTLLYFGYTQCPDVCPLTLQRVAQVFDKLGKDAQHFRFLFVTVDPHRDTAPVLKQYTEAFSPLFIGLRGDDNAIARLARRYRIAYSVTPATKSHPYEVTHSSAIYIFTPDGAPKLLLGSLASTDPDINGTAEDLEHLLHQPKPGLLSRLFSSL
jgi:protein SCO1